MDSRTYSSILILVALLIPSGLWLHDFTIEMRAVMHECTIEGHTSDEYLAYCAGDHYGSYEHSAIYFDQEPYMLNNLKEAEILFLGNSRMQVALSTQATVDFFSHFPSRRPFYMLGFGYSEPYRFSLEVIKKHRLHPKVVVVNADNRYFEQGTTSRPAARTLEDEKEPLHNFTKNIKYHLLYVLCGNHPERCGDRKSIYRARTNGVWNVDHYGKINLESFAIPHGADESLIDTYKLDMSEFMREIPVPPKCVLFITVPTPFVSPESGEVMAKIAGARFVKTNSPGDIYETMDSDHLARASAQKYSKQALPKLNADFKRCGVNTGN